MSATAANPRTRRAPPPRPKKKVPGAGPKRKKSSGVSDAADTLTKLEGIGQVAAKTKNRRGWFFGRKKPRGDVLAPSKLANPKPGRGSFSLFRSNAAASMKFEEEDLLEPTKQKRTDSVALRRKAKQTMTHSLKLDQDIFAYLQEREPSVASTEADERSVNSYQQNSRSVQGKKPAKPRGMILDGGEARVATMEPIRELKRREEEKQKQKTFFGKMRSRLRFLVPSRKGVRKLANRLSFGSFAETNVEDIQALLHERDELERKKNAELIRKDSDDTDLSDDIDGTLLALDRNSIQQEEKADPSAGEQEEREESRLEKIFDSGEMADEAKEEAAEKKTAPIEKKTKDVPVTAGKKSDAVKDAETAAKHLDGHKTGSSKTDQTKKTSDAAGSEEETSTDIKEEVSIPPPPPSTVAVGGTE